MRLVLTLIIGALGGMSATGPMTIAMVVFHRWLPSREKYPLPPREITKKAAQKLHLDRQLTEPAGTALTLVNHFAYGSACGAIYAGATGKIPVPFVVRGIIFGTIV